MKINGSLNFARSRFGLPYWSLADYAKHKVKTAVNFMSDFEESVAHECKSRGLDGAICGHIHNAAIRDINGVQYYNTGDWVDSCTALVEHHDGRIELLDWSAKRFSNSPAKRSVGETTSETIGESQSSNKVVELIPRTAAKWA